MILTEKEAEILDKLLTCSKCGSRKVEIYYVGVLESYVKCCRNCGYCEKLEGLKWE